MPAFFVCAYAGRAAHQTNDGTIDVLSLTRREGEAIVINGNITVKVYQIRKGAVVLGIDAPREIPIHRLEVQERIQAGEAPDSQER